MSPNGPFFKEEIQLRHTELSKQASAQLQQQQQHLGEREGENLGVRMNSDRVSSRPDRQTCLEEAYTLVASLCGIHLACHASMQARHFLYYTTHRDPGQHG